MDKHTEILNSAYEKALDLSQKNEYEALSIDIKVKEQIKLIVSRAEDNKGIIAVLTTLLSHKLVHPAQDIRNHQAQIANGFSGRSIDKDFITPWIKEHSFPAMA